MIVKGIALFASLQMATLEGSTKEVWPYQGPYYFTFHSILRQSRASLSGAKCLDLLKT